MKTLCNLSAVALMIGTGYYLFNYTWTMGGLLICFFAVAEAAILTTLGGFM